MGHQASGRVRRSAVYALAQTATDLAAATEAIEAERPDRRLIERMLEQAIGVGVANPSAVEEPRHGGLSSIRAGLGRSENRRLVAFADMMGGNARDPP